MAGKTIRVLARGDLLAPVHGLHARGLSRFVGRVDDFHNFGTPFTYKDESGQDVRAVAPARICVAEPHVFRQDDDETEFTEQLLHLRHGVLWPFDEATARMAGVAFDPTYGGEYTKSVDGKLVNVAHDKALAALKKSTAPADAPSTQEKK